jgi:hypothetical protein
VTNPPFDVVVPEVRVGAAPLRTWHVFFTEIVSASIVPYSAVTIEHALSLKSSNVFGNRAISNHFPRYRGKSIMTGVTPDGGFFASSRDLFDIK